MAHAMLIEDRLAALEKDVAVAGSMQDEPDFDTVLQLGRQARKADEPADEQSP
jgi:hypothetical protein